MQIEKSNTDILRTIFSNPLKSFVLRLILIVICWLVFYTILLKPSRIIDKPLTNFLTKTVVTTINAVSPQTPPLGWVDDVEAKCAYFTQNNKKIFGVFDYCNGIDLIFIYITIIFLLPYSIKRKLIFTIGGTTAIIALNIVRIFCLYLIYTYNRTAFDISHHYLFTFLMYLLIFYGWLLYTKNQKHTNI
jgi:exosortase/archaeosortase family protein